MFCIYFKNDLKEIDEESGDEKENESIKTEPVKEGDKKRNVVRTEEDIMEEYGLADYDEEQVC